jgi:hypothetical protein
MALFKHMEETNVVFHTKERITTSNVIHHTPFGFSYAMIEKNILKYFVDDILIINIIYDDQKIGSRKHYKGGIHNPEGPITSTHDIIWLINQYYNN